MSHTEGQVNYSWAEAKSKRNIRSSQPATAPRQGNCPWCGSQSHPKGKSDCPAKGKQCYAYGRFDHLGKVCMHPIPIWREAQRTPSANNTGNFPNTRNAVMNKNQPDQIHYNSSSSDDDTFSYSAFAIEHQINAACDQPDTTPDVRRNQLRQRARAAGYAHRQQLYRRKGKKYYSLIDVRTPNSTSAKTFQMNFKSTQEPRAMSYHKVTYLK